MRDKVARQCQQTTTFEEKAEPKRNRTEVPLLSTLTIYREAKPAHCLSDLFSIHPHPKGGLMSPSCVLSQGYYLIAPMGAANCSVRDFPVSKLFLPRPFQWETLYTHTPRLAFRHRPPNSAITGYAIEVPLLISAHLSIEDVRALRKAWVLIKLWKQRSTHVNTRRLRPE